jgi:hypothetical protein
MIDLMELNTLQSDRATLISVSGAGHSGTTLLASMVGSHPDVHLITWETGWFLGEDDFEYPISELKQFLKDGVSVVVEKTPRHMYHIDKIAKTINGTKFLVTIRNPLDLVSSLLLRYQDWDRALERVLEDFEALEAIEGRDDVLFVHYENLVEKTEETLGEVCQHVKLGFSPDILQWHTKTPNWFGVEPAASDGVGELAHMRRRAWQVQQPLFNGTRRWEQELDSSQVVMAKKVFHGLLKRWGY